MQLPDNQRISGEYSEGSGQELYSTRNEFPAQQKQHRYELRLQEVGGICIDLINKITTCHSKGCTEMDSSRGEKERTVTWRNLSVDEIRARLNSIHLTDSVGVSIMMEKKCELDAITTKLKWSM